MNRSDFLKITTGGLSVLLLKPQILKGNETFRFHKMLFGNNFAWGVATSAPQIEGAWNADGRGESIWDQFNHKSGNIKDKSNGDISCNFYDNYPNDLQLLKEMNFTDFRFSFSWSRILPKGTGEVNMKGINFYNRLINKCIELNIKPWATIYHWDLPQHLEDKGGWTNRDVIDWFSEFTTVCAKYFGDRVHNWLVMNEPVSFTTFGYLTGLHAPGRMGISKFLASVHHAAMCQAEGGRILKRMLPNARIGTALSCSQVMPYTNKPSDLRTCKRIDVALNRLFIEPLLGMGYPISDLPFLKKMNKYILPGDLDKLKFEFDFIGLQNYFRVVAKSGYIPILWAQYVKPDKNKTDVTEMDWEVYPNGIYHSIKSFSKYPIKEIVITENGAAYIDELVDGKIHDYRRIQFFKSYLEEVLKAKNEGANVTGYFAWTLIDNFEWAEGYRPRFGLIYNNFETQTRTIKDSGYWFRDFLQ